MHLCTVLNVQIRITGKHYCFHFLFSSRFYRACGQRTSVCSLLTGALLEATVALGARSALLYPLPQGPNSHTVLKGKCAWCCLVVCLCVKH